MSPPTPTPTPPRRHVHVSRLLFDVVILQRLGVVRRRHVRRACGFCCSGCSIKGGGGEVCLLQCSCVSQCPHGLIIAYVLPSTSQIAALSGLSRAAPVCILREG